MERNKILAYIKTNIALLPKNYLFYEEEGYNGLPVIIIKKNTEFVYNIGLWIDKNNSYSEFNTTIYFKEIEDVINPLLMKNKIIRSYTEENNWTILLKRIEPEVFKQTLNPSYPKTIKTEQDIIDLLKDLNEYSKNVAEPFFEKWSDLRVLDKFLDTIPQMEVQNYVSEGVLSKALVYKLCSNPKFDEYFDLLYNYYTKRYADNPTGDEVCKKMNDFMIDFKEVLDGITPKYNV